MTKVFYIGVIVEDDEYERLPQIVSNEDFYIELDPSILEKELEKSREYLDEDTHYEIWEVTKRIVFDYPDNTKKIWKEVR